MSRKTEAVIGPYGYRSITPLPSAEVLQAYYRDKYFAPGREHSQYAHEYTAEELEHKRLPAAEALAVAASVVGNSKAKRLYEIAVGEGFFLDAFVSAGWEARGCDFTEDGLLRFFPQHAKRLDVGDVFSLLESAISANHQYELVACNHVLEHVVDPERLVRDVRKIIAPNGLCRFAVPNDGSWIQHEAIARGFAPEDFYLAPPEHLHYFTADTLRGILERNGFVITDMLADFPIDAFLLNPESAYVGRRAHGRAAHFARVAFEMGLWKRGLPELLEYRRASAKAGVGRVIVAYARVAA